MNELITSLTDERMDDKATVHGESIKFYRDCLRLALTARDAALSRAEAAEGKICRAKEIIAQHFTEVPAELIASFSLLLRPPMLPEELALIKKLSESYQNGQSIMVEEYVSEEIRSLVRAVREDCAKIGKETVEADELARFITPNAKRGMANEIAAAIRGSK